LNSQICEFCWFFYKIILILYLGSWISKVINLSWLECFFNTFSLFFVLFCFSLFCLLETLPLLFYLNFFCMELSHFYKRVASLTCRLETRFFLSFLKINYFFSIRLSTFDLSVTKLQFFFISHCYFIFFIIGFFL